MSRRRPRVALLGAGALVFVLLAALNAGGYRYGAADQAFYIPAILLDLDARLFPRDSQLIGAQDGLILFDEIVAGTARLTGLSVPVLFAAAYVLGSMLLAAAAWAVAVRVHESGWSAAAFVTALTLRHRIAKTGVNTLEGYLHPRMLAFAVGLAAVACLMRRRYLPTASLLVVAGALHPSTALFFGIWLAVAAAVIEPRLRAPVVGGAVVGGAALAALAAGPWRQRFVVMDESWEAVLASKDYIFPTAWAAETWALNMLYPVVIVGVFAYRRRLGLARAEELGLVVGSLALLGLFLATLPLIAARVAIAVQLQISRVFWMLDVFATLYAVWLLGENPAWRRNAVPARAPALVFACLFVAAAARGAYVAFVEHRERPPFQLTLPADDWTAVLRWAARTPIDSHWLADPAHGWRFGTSLRVGGERDLYLEEVKDAAIALYSEDVAERVATRTRDLPPFHQLDAAHARRLAARYDLDFLVSERRLDLPVAFSTGRFFVYALQ